MRDNRPRCRSRSGLAVASPLTLVVALFVVPLAGRAAALEPSPDMSSAPIIACSAAALYLEDRYVSVQVGGRTLSEDTVLGGPAACVGHATTDSSNVRVMVQRKGQFATIRIIALRDGFANVSVAAANGRKIGEIRVSVYPRELHVNRGR